MGKKFRSYRIIALIGLAGVLLYFLHVFIGQVGYPGYRAASQAVSDLTAVGAPSRGIALALSTLYGLCMVIFSAGLWVTFRDRINATFSLGCGLLIGMQAVSLLGYLLFPASSADGWRSIMHLIVTGAVVILSVAALLFLGLGCWSRYRWLAAFSFVAIFMMLVGTILTNIVSNQYFGYAERIPIFTLVLYHGVLAIWMMCYQPRRLSWY